MSRYRDSWRAQAVCSCGWRGDTRVHNKNPVVAGKRATGDRDSHRASGCSGDVEVFSWAEIGCRLCRWLSHAVAWEDTDQAHEARKGSEQHRRNLELSEMASQAVGEAGDTEIPSDPPPEMPPQVSLPHREPVGQCTYCKKRLDRPSDLGGQKAGTGEREHPACRERRREREEARKKARGIPPPGTQPSWSDSSS